MRLESKLPPRRSTSFAVFPSLRGFEIGVDGDVDAALEVISKAGLTV